MKKVSKNVFMYSYIKISELIGYESIDEVLENTRFVGDFIYEYGENDIYEYDEVKGHIIKKYSITKNELKNINIDTIIRSILSNQYTNNYERELIEDLENHIKEQLEGLQYNFEILGSNEVVSIYEATHIKVAITKKEFFNRFYDEYGNDYNTKKEFYDDASDIFEEYIHDLEEYNYEFFDYYGGRIDCDGWEDSVEYDYYIDELLINRKKHYEKIKNWIKNKVPLIYRESL